MYLVQRDPANNVLRVDLPSSTATPVITGLPINPSGIAVNLMAGAVYVAADSKVVEVGLLTLPMGEPVFLAVGRVPSTKIVDGYATTEPDSPLPVKMHWPSGSKAMAMGIIRSRWNSSSSNPAAGFKPVTKLKGNSPTVLVDELWPKVGDGVNRGRRHIVGVFEPPLLHRRSDMPCPTVTSPN